MSSEITSSVELSSENQEKEEISAEYPFFDRLWMRACESNAGLGAWIGYVLSTMLGVALVVLCIPQLWHLGEGHISGLCFGCVKAPVFSLSLDPWQTIAFAGLYLNGVIAGCYGIYQGVLWVYMGGRQLRRQLLKQRRVQGK